MKEILLALIGPVLELIAAGMADDYDPEAERQAALKLQRAMYDERLKRLLAGK